MRDDLDRRTFLSIVPLSVAMAGCSAERGQTPTDSEAAGTGTTGDRTTTESSDHTATESPTQSATDTPTETDRPTDTDTPTETNRATDTTSETDRPTETATETDDGTDTPADLPEPSRQPKIREVQDNFGNTFTFDGDDSGSARVDDEIVVDDDTAVELCVTDVAAAAGDDVRFSYWFGGSQRDHSDNTAGDARKVENCRRWEMQREDYASHWRFSIWVRNDDDIYYQNDAVESDFRIVVYYTNLTLAES